MSPREGGVGCANPGMQRTLPQSAQPWWTNSAYRLSDLPTMRHFLRLPYVHWICADSPPHGGEIRRMPPAICWRRPPTTAVPLLHGSDERSDNNGDTSSSSSCCRWRSPTADRGHPNEPGQHRLQKEVLRRKGPSRSCGKLPACFSGRKPDKSGAMDSPVLPDDCLAAGPAVVFPVTCGDRDSDLLLAYRGYGLAPR